MSTIHNNNIPKTIEILHQDEDLIFVNKPSGLASQSSVDISRGDLLSQLKTQLKSDKVFLHHRLDVGTSGVMVFAIHPRVNKAMTDIFREKKAKKKYWAIAKGSSTTGKIWTIENYLRKVNRGKKQKMASVTSGGDPALTHFKCLASAENLSLIECEPLTGRTHQIRVHLAEDHFPILGDRTYGGQDPEAARLMLHAQCLEIPHPRTGIPLRVEAPLPSDFTKLLNRHFPNWNAKR